MVTESCPLHLLNDFAAIAIPRQVHWDPIGLMAVRKHVQDALASLGNVDEHRFHSAAGEGVNLILKLPGRDSSLKPMLVGAHYDGPLQSIGADDNASGVVALLELARRWSATPPRRPVWLVAFDQEEWGMHGSSALATALRRERQPLKLMVSLEMLAYTDPHQNYPIAAMRRLYGHRGDFITLIGNIRAAWIIARLTRAMGRHVKTKLLPVPLRGQMLSDVRRSDHSPFWDQGYDALMITDTSFMRNPNYHRMTDTIDTLDLPFFASVIDGLDTGLAAL